MCMLVSMSYGLWCHASGHSPHAHPPNRAYMERTICWVGYPIILPATAPEPSVSRTPQEVLEVIAHHTRPLTLFVALCTLMHHRRTHGRRTLWPRPRRAIATAQKCGSARDATAAQPWHARLPEQVCDVTPRSHLIATLQPPRGQRQRQVRGVTPHSMTTTSPYPHMWAGVGRDTTSSYDYMYIPPTPHAGRRVT